MSRGAPKDRDPTSKQYAKLKRAIVTYWVPVRQSHTAAANKGEPCARKVLQLVGVTFRREGRGWAQRDLDQWRRKVLMIGPKGSFYWMDPSPKVVSRISRHYDAVWLYLESGGASGLRELKGKYIVDRYGIALYFCTDPATVRRIVERDRIRFKIIRGRWFVMRSAK